MRRFKQSLPLHVALVLILLGGCLTWLTGQRGSIALKPGESATTMATEGGQEVALPFSVALQSFDIDYYPGGVAPRDYRSRLTINGEPHTVAMNHIASVSNYRFYQSGYLPDGTSILSVNHDPWGIAVTYAGYLLFAISAIWLLIAPNGTFRRLLRRLAVAAMMLLPVLAEARTVPVLSRAEADEASREQVVYAGRVAPFGTLARDFMLKLHGSATYAGFTAEQIVGGWAADPQAWQSEPIILIKDAQLRSRLGLQRKYASLSELFDANGYRLQPLYGGNDTSLDKAILEVDEKVGLIMSLNDRKLIVPRPADMAPLPDWRITLELCYISIASTPVTFIVGLLGGIVALIVAASRRRWHWLSTLLQTVLSATLAFELLLFAARWIISAHIPLSNTYETLRFVAIAVMAIAAALWRREPLSAALGMLLAGFVLLVVRLIGYNPQITPLVPVLASPWLSIHVTVIMMSYALLAFTFALAVGSLLWRPMARRMALVSRLLLYPAIVSLGIGIILGAVWANISWGRYWAWDPKETWALVTLLIYALPLHRPVMRRLSTPRRFHLFIALAFISVIMTYFGVNYLGGMHAYGN